MPFVSFLPAGAGLAGLFTRQSDRYGPCMEIGKELMTGPSEMERSERELLAAYISSLNACSFCIGTHSGIANAFGWGVDVLEALLADPAEAPIPDRLVPIIGFARKLTQEPARMTQSDADAITAAGWSEQTVSDVAAITAYYAMTNRLASGHGVEALTGEDNEAIGRNIAEHGYPGIESLPQPSFRDSGQAL